MRRILTIYMQGINFAVQTLKIKATFSVTYTACNYGSATMLKHWSEPLLHMSSIPVIKTDDRNSVIHRVRLAGGKDSGSNLDELKRLQLLCYASHKAVNSKSIINMLERFDILLTMHRDYLRNKNNNVLSLCILF